MPHSIRDLSVASLLLAAVVSVPAYAEPERVVIAQQDTVVVAMAPVPSMEVVTAPTETFAAIETGVRRAAREGNDALRRYIWRTRMIYNYAFNDWAKEQ